MTANNFYEKVIDFSNLILNCISSICSPLIYHKSTISFVFYSIFLLDPLQLGNFTFYNFLFNLDSIIQKVVHDFNNSILDFFFPCRIQFNYHHWLAILFDLSLDREHWLWLTININVSC